MAKASPRASITVVDAVGAKPIPQASCSMLRSRATSLASARVESMAQQKLIKRRQFALAVGNRRRISSVSPLAESASTRSPLANMPKIAVQRLGRMKERGGCSGRIEGGDQLLRDDSAFAYAGDHDPPAAAAALHHQVHGAGEMGRHAILEAVRKSKQGFGFYPDQLGWSECAHQANN